MWILVITTARDFPGELWNMNISEEIVSYKEKQKRLLNAKLKAIKEMKHLRELKIQKNSAVLSDWSSTDYEDETKKSKKKITKVKFNKF